MDLNLFKYTSFIGCGKLLLGFGVTSAPYNDEVKLLGYQILLKYTLCVAVL